MSEFVESSYREVTISLARLHDNTKIVDLADVLKVISLTHASALPRLRIGTEAAPSMAISAGKVMKARMGAKFRGVYLETGLAVAGASIEFGIYQDFELEDPETLVTDFVKDSGDVIANSVTTVELAIPTGSVLAGRHGVTIQNLGPDAVYLGYTSGVLVTTGIKIANGGNWIRSLSEAVPVYLISDGTSDCRVEQVK